MREARISNCATATPLAAPVPASPTRCSEPMVDAKSEPPPDTLKVCMNRDGGFRNDMRICLTGLDVDAKAKVVEDAFWRACPYEPDDYQQVTTRVLHTNKEDPASNEEAIAIWHIAVKDPDDKKVGRAFSDAVTQLAKSFRRSASSSTTSWRPWSKDSRTPSRRSARKAGSS